MEQSVHRLDTEAVILEKAQNEQIHHQGKDQVPFPPGLVGQTAQLQTHDVVERDAEQHQHHIDRLAPGVKEDAADQKHHVFSRDGGNHQRQQEHNGQEQEQKI